MAIKKNFKVTASVRFLMDLCRKYKFVEGDPYLNLIILWRIRHRLLNDLFRQGGREQLNEGKDKRTQIGALLDPQVGDVIAK